MSLLKNQFWFIKDLIYQSIIFFLALLLPTVYVSKSIDTFGNSVSEYFVEDLIDNIINSDKNIILSSLYYIIISYIGSLVYSLFPIIVNTYMMNYNNFRIIKEDYYAFKLLILFILNATYVIFLTLGKGDFIYYLFGIPVLITTLYYILYKKMTKKNV